MSDGEQPDDTQKTEDPSQRKLEEARKKGQVAISRELNNWIMLLAGTLVVAMGAPAVLSGLMVHLRLYIEHAGDFPGAPGGLKIVLGDSLMHVLAILVVPVAALLFAAFIGPFMQVGPLFAPEVITPDLSKLSPVQGLKRLFSMRALMEFFKGLLKLCVISAVGFAVIRPYFGQVDHLVGMPIPLMMDEMMTLFIRLMTGVLAVLLVIAVIDVVWQRQEHYRKMRMTKQEVKDEFKQSEGDPHIKARLRQLRNERARKRMIQAVPQADVVITNPTHFAVALKYRPEEMEAPLCVAKGFDELALRIREVAKEHEVEVIENPPLARALFEAVEVDQTIPPEHYKAVAEIISFVFRKQGKLKPKPG